MLFGRPDSLNNEIFNISYSRRPLATEKVINYMSKEMFFLIYILGLEDGILFKNQCLLVDITKQMEKLYHEVPTQPRKAKEKRQILFSGPIVLTVNSRNEPYDLTGGAQPRGSWVISDIPTAL